MAIFIFCLIALFCVASSIKLALSAGRLPRSTRDDELMWIVYVTYGVLTLPMGVQILSGLCPEQIKATISFLSYLTGAPLILYLSLPASGEDQRSES